MKTSLLCRCDEREFDYSVRFMRRKNVTREISVNCDYSDHKFVKWSGPRDGTGNTDWLHKCSRRELWPLLSLGLGSICITSFHAFSGNCGFYRNFVADTLYFMMNIYMSHLEKWNIIIPGYIYIIIMQFLSSLVVMRVLTLIT